MMNALPSVSVIMPWHNTPIPLVKRAIDSVIRQDYEGPIELVVCNDGSRAEMVDDLISMLKEQLWGQKTFRICHHSTKRGISAARNSAVNCATGEWLIWLDADDELVSSAIRLMINIARTRGASMVISQCLFIENENCFVRRPEVYLALAHSYYRTLFDPLMQVVFSIQAQLVQRNLFDALGGFNTNYKWAEATEFFLRFVCQFSLDRVHTISHPLYKYYRRKGTHSSNREQLNSARKDALLAYAHQQSIPVDGLEYLGRCLSTGAQHYIPIVDGEIVLPPYVKINKTSTENQITLELTGIGDSADSHQEGKHVGHRIF